VTDELDDLMVAVYGRMRRERHWIRQAAAAMGMSYPTLDRLLVGVTRQPTPATLDALYRYAHGTERPA
jgi:hypothetical protein